MQISNHPEDRTYHKGDRGGRGGNFSGRDGRSRGGGDSYRRSNRGPIEESGLRSPNISTSDDRNDTSVKSILSDDPDVPISPPSEIPATEPSIPSAPATNVVKSYHSLNLHRLNWETYHSAECKHGCRNERSHYTKWREAYEEHLWDLYTIFTSQKVNLSKINYNLFVVFVYNNSSRFISEFA